MCTPKLIVSTGIQLFHCTTLHLTYYLQSMFTLPVAGLPMDAVTMKNSWKSEFKDSPDEFSVAPVIMKRCWLFSCKQLDSKETYLADVSTGGTGASGRNVSKISFFAIKLSTREQSASLHEFKDLANTLCGKRSHLLYQYASHRPEEVRPLAIRSLIIDLNFVYLLWWKFSAGILVIFGTINYEGSLLLKQL